MQHTTHHFHSADGTRLFYQAWQPANTPARACIALVHGWSDHSGRYMNLVNHVVPQGYAVYALDLRGHGNSEGGRGHVQQWADYRNDVHGFLAKVSTAHPTLPRFLMGHSMGGLVVLEYAIHHPNAGLAGLIASAPLLSEPNISPVLVALADILSNIVPALSISPGADANTISRDPAVVQAYLADPLVHGRATPRAATEGKKARAFVQQNADAIRVPFLLFYGDADALVPPQTSREVFGKISSPDKTRHEYVGGYHEMLNDTDKAQVLADVSAWLHQHS